jgi:hypothetical protein
LDGSFVYRPAKDYCGGDRFTYSVSDGHGAEDRATVAVTVGALPEPPDSGGRGCTIIGTGGNDVLDGGAGKDETIH